MCFFRTGIPRAQLGEVADWRPDLIVVNRNGKVDLYDVLSPSQTEEELIDKLRQMRAALPPNNRRHIYLYDTSGGPIQIPGESPP